VFSENGGAEGSRMTQRMTVLQTENLIICDESGLTPAMMRAVLRGVAKRHGGIGMAVVDYIQLMDANKALPNNRNQELTAISRDIKRMAMDFNMPFVVISQLTKDVEKLKRRPTNGDLRESGAIAQDADMILMVTARRNTRPARRMSMSARRKSSSRKTGTASAEPCIAVTTGQLSGSTNWGQSHGDG
jgi:Replicative DNA helicase